MRLRDYFRIYDEDELVRGAELYFSGDLENFTVKKVSGSKIKSIGSRKNNKEEEPEGDKPLNGLFEDEITELSGNFDERGVKKDRTRIFCSLKLHKRFDIVCEAECDCSDFAGDHYGCPHTAALLTAYMAEEKGEQVFSESRLETLLKNRTNVEDPFLPGVLKRTDGRLLSLLTGSENDSLAVWKEPLVSRDPLYIECRMELSKGSILVDMKAGVGKRAYQIQDLQEFLTAYRAGGLFSLGKNEIRLQRGCCREQSGKILDFLSGLLTAFEKGLYRAKLFAVDAQKRKRYAMLSGPEFDEFMSLSEGMSIGLEDSKSRKVSLSKRGLEATVKKKAYGASLFITPASVFCSNGTNVYLYDDSDIFLVKAENTEKIHELISLLGWTDELYIRESELGQVCRNLLPVFNRYGTVTARGLDLENYDKEIPEFIFNLDRPSEGMLTCIPYAVYKRQEGRYLLFDRDTDPGKRNGKKESEAADILPEFFDRLDKESGTLFSELDEEGLFDFMKDKLPKLEALGKVMATESLMKNRVRTLPRLSVGVSAESGNMLLSLKGSGISAFEMAEILGAYRKKKKFYRLRSGEFFALNDGRDDIWNKAAGIFGDYGKKDPENIKIPAFRALYLNNLMENREDADFEADEGYKRLIEEMDVTGLESLEPPSSLKKIIRPYQTEGFRWIKMLKRCGFGGILADDMGLGKTLQVLAFILSEKLDKKQGDELRTLVVCPASLVYNWQREIENYTPELNSVVIAGSVQARKEIIENSKDTDIWITSYDLLKRDIPLYEDITFANEIIDEAQFVKNQNTQASQSVRVVKSSFRMALTGTPIENYLSELWSIMDYLMPGFLFQYGKFQSEYETPVVAKKDAEVLERLRSMVHPFILRRLKKQVLKELPDKLLEVVSVRMEAGQRRLYDASVEEIRCMLDKVSTDEFRSGKLQFLAKLTGLRQICCDPSLIYDGYSEGSAKLDACMQLVDEAVSGGHKLLLFSQFTSMLDIISEELRKKEIDFYRLDGSVSKERRMEMVDAFAGDEVKVFLISLKAGGTGLNLTAADIVIHYDPWWNQAAQDQATDRTHRIGQTRAVTVYELIVQDTVEERIQKIKEAKSKLVEDVLSGGEISSASFNKEDMLELLS